MSKSLMSAIQYTTLGIGLGINFRPMDAWPFFLISIIFGMMLNFSKLDKKRG